jgi:hypothetical protein
MLKSTKDIYLSAAWLALGAKYERVDRSEPRHMEFFFSSGEDHVSEPARGTLVIMRDVDLELIEKQWANAELVVNAVKFKEALQRMKSLVHSK